jgi:exonuclease SbcC
VAKRSLKRIQDQNLDEKIKKYDEILSQERDLFKLSSEISLSLSKKKQSLDSEQKLMKSSRERLDDLKSRVTNDESSTEISSIKNEIRILESESRSLDAEKLAVSELLGRLDSDIKKLKVEKNKYKKLLEEWNLFNLMMNAFSKKGIPLQIMTSQLPAINKEIAKILQESAGFTVELEADTSTNAMDIYINYGDSKRIVECASGMEKMMASLAIRVAFINISSLPKTNVLIIDEGFGALDDTNIESCSRLLRSLKKWFKNILIISHVDAIKDAVDNVLDITNEGKDSIVVHE